MTNGISSSQAKKALFSIANAALNSGMASVYCRGIFVKVLYYTFGYVTLQDGLHEIVGVSADSSGIAVHLCSLAINENDMDTNTL